MGVMEVAITQEWEWGVTVDTTITQAKVTSNREEIIRAAVVALTVVAKWAAEVVVSVILLTSLTTQSCLALQSI